MSELIQWSPKEKCFALLSNSSMYGDQSEEFVWLILGLNVTLAAHDSLIHSKDQTAWLSTRRICPITTLPFLTLIWNLMNMKFALSPPVWMTFEIDDILWCDHLNETSLVALSQCTIYFSTWNLEMLLINFFWFWSLLKQTQ